jgi:cyanophycin synthetase
VPKAGERVVLRRVANISAGGVSINVTDRIHPANVKLVEDIAKFFRVTCLGIDVLTEDISRPWTDGKLGIIEINAGPGVFMHLGRAAVIGVPGRIGVHFPGRAARSILAANRLSPAFCRIWANGRAAPGSASAADRQRPSTGAFFKHRGSQNVRIILRNPRVDFAVFTTARRRSWNGHVPRRRRGDLDAPRAKRRS